MLHLLWKIWVYGRILDHGFRCEPRGRPPSQRSRVIVNLRPSRRGSKKQICQPSQYQL